VNNVLQATFSDAGHRLRWVRATYVTFCFAALPLVLLAIFIIAVVWWTWPQRGIGVMEGPEPTDAEVIACCIALGFVILAYLCTLLFSYRIMATRFSWVPFVIQVPALVWLVILRLRWSSDPVIDRLWISLYPVLLLVILSIGVISSLRLHAAARNA
jgi:hypothetical protein